MEKKINIVYFSGTGGTEKAAKCFETEFINTGYTVKLLRLQAGSYFGYSDNTPLMLLFPVYAMNAPGLVYDWLSSIATSNSVPAMVISVSGGGETSPNTACRVKAIKMLENKGYIVTYEEMLIMPANVFINLKPEISKLLIDALPKKAKRIVSEIDSGKTLRKKPLAIDRLFSSLGHMEEKGAKSIGQTIAVSESCIGCGWCSENCPTGNISIVDGKPSFSDKCNFCLSCIYGCPKKALTPRKGKFAVLKQGYSLNEIEKLPPIESADIDKLTKGWLYGGLKDAD